MSRDVRVVARSKLTLSLRVLGRRADGFHDLEALVVSLRDPHDVIGLRIQPPFGVRVRLSGRAVVGVPADDTNLAARAAQLLLEAAAEGDDPGPWAASGLDLSLHKTIPAGAGLGGGSADAAGTLVGGARLLGLDLDTARLAALGAVLGSDVPFCVTGGAAWMRGRGEILEPIELPASAVVPAGPGLSQLMPAPGPGPFGTVTAPAAPGGLGSPAPAGPASASGAGSAGSEPAAHSSARSGSGSVRPGATGAAGSGGRGSSGSGKSAEPAGYGGAGPLGALGLPINLGLPGAAGIPVPPGASRVPGGSPPAPSAAGAGAGPGPGPTDEGGLALVVAVPQFALNTAAVYRAWDELGGARSDRAVPLPAGLAGLGLPDQLVNDLEPAAESVDGRLRPFRDALEALVGAPALLAGSGSAYVVPVASPAQAAVLANQISVELRATAFATGLAARGVEAQRALE